MVYINNQQQRIMNLQKLSVLSDFPFILIPEVIKYAVLLILKETDLNSITNCAEVTLRPDSTAIIVFGKKIIVLFGHYLMEIDHL